MFNVRGLPGWAIKLIAVLYSTYVIAIALFALAIVVLAIFDIRDVKINTAVVALLVLALIAPLVPFVQQIGVPGGGTLALTGADADHITRTTRQALEQAAARIAQLDFEEMTSRGSAEQSG